MAIDFSKFLENVEIKSTKGKGRKLYNIANCNELYKKVKGRECEDSKTLRKFMRSFMNSQFWSNKPNEDNIKNFLVFYENLYLVNDFSFTSVSASDDDLNKNRIENFLSSAKAYKEKQNKK